MAKDTLTPKQEAFVRAYLETGNACEAYRRAYKPKRMKAASVDKEARRLLANPRIAPRLKAAQTAVAERHNITVDRIIAEYAKIAFADAGDFFEWGPDGVTVRDKSELTADQRSAVSEVSQTITAEGGTIRVKLHSKMDALDKLGRHLGMFKDGDDDPPDDLNLDEVRGAIASKLDRIADAIEKSSVPRKP